jgi:YVTN family beta-propeller protein
LNQIAVDPTAGAAGAVTSTTADPPVVPGSVVTTVPGSVASQEPVNIYAHAGAGDMSPAVKNAKAYVYVPSNDDGSVTVIDQKTMKVITHYKVGTLLQHVVPGWDLTTLYATASGSNRLVPIDPTTGKPGKGIPVQAPYNLYFTPDGKKAVVMAERLRRIDFYDRITWKLIKSVPAPCRGVNHADWSPDGAWFLATCEFSGEILKVDTNSGDILNVLPLPAGAMPQDLRIAPDGTKFYVADMMSGGVWILDAQGTKIIGSIKTGVGAHGIYPSRDATRIYVTNRGRLSGDVTRKSKPGDGSISVVDPTTDTVVATWPIPGGGSPDMGGVSADGSTFWVSGRYDDVVYVFDTTTGELRAQISVPSGPHGLAVFPQPGRYSLGHTGNTR